MPPPIEAPPSLQVVFQGQVDQVPSWGAAQAKWHSAEFTKRIDAIGRCNATRNVCEIDTTRMEPRDTMLDTLLGVPRVEQKFAVKCHLNTASRCNVDGALCSWMSHPLQYAVCSGPTMEAHEKVSLVPRSRCLQARVGECVSERCDRHCVADCVSESLACSLVGCGAAVGVVAISAIVCQCAHLHS